MIACATIQDAMTQRTRTGRPTREQAAELELQLREAAVEVFLERGFDGATMEEIARVAGITKRTLYQKYPNKRELFVQVLPWAMSAFEAVAPLDIPVDDLRTALLVLARDALERAIDPRLTQLRRIAMSEVHQFPEFTASSRSMSWSPRLRYLADLLARHADSGDIVLDDPDLSAEQFLAMVAGFPTILATFGVRREAEDEKRHIEHAVDLFLRGLLPRHG